MDERSGFGNVLDLQMQLMCSHVLLAATVLQPECTLNSDFKFPRAAFHSASFGIRTACKTEALKPQKLKLQS